MEAKNALFWAGSQRNGGFLGGIRAFFYPRGLQGVLLVTSDAHEGLKAAFDQVLTGASWQRCWVHFMRNVLAHVPHWDQAMVAAALRTIYTQPNPKPIQERWAIFGQPKLTTSVFGSSSIPIKSISP